METVIYFRPSAYLVALSLTEGFGGPDLLEHRETALDLVVVLPIGLALVVVPVGVVVVVLVVRFFFVGTKVMKVVWRGCLWL